MKRILTILLAFTLAFTMSTPALAGSAVSEAIPLDSTSITIEQYQAYSISTKEELVNFAKLVNGGQDFDTATVYLLADIAFNEGTFSAGPAAEIYPPYLNGAPVGSDVATWTPIGTGINPFRGIFEGNHHTISGLFYDFGSGGAVAVFGACSSARIQNLKVDNFYFRGVNLAGICASMYYGTSIKNCHVTNGTMITRGLSGGIAGTAPSSHTGEGLVCSIINCTADTIIREGVRHTSGISENHDSGGIIGSCSSTQIVNCTSSGENSGTSNIGSIIGSAGENVTMSACNGLGIAAGSNYHSRLIGNDPSTGPHKHTFSTEYSWNENHHYYICSCGAMSGNGSHMFTQKVVTEPTGSETGLMEKTCTVCGAVFNETMPLRPSYTLEVEGSKYKDYIDLWQNSTLMIAAKEGAYVKDVILNGVSLGSVSQVSFTDGAVIRVIFAAKPAEEKELTAAEKKRIIRGVEATTIKASSVNVSNGSIRITWKKSPGYKVDYYQIYRSTKRNIGYGKKPFYTTKTGSATKYTNSKNLKVGTRYYYKVRGVRVIDGEKYYTQYSNKANRVAKKAVTPSGAY